MGFRGRRPAPRLELGWVVGMVSVGAVGRTPERPDGSGSAGRLIKSTLIHVAFPASKFPPWAIRSPVILSL